MLTNILSAEESGGTSWIFIVVLLVVFVVAMFIVPIFTNKKRTKETQSMYNSLKVGDTIKTIGGIIGTIKEIKTLSPNERVMILETGEEDSKTTMSFDIQALYQVLSSAPIETLENENLDNVSETEEQPTGDITNIVEDNNRFVYTNGDGIKVLTEEEAEAEIKAAAQDESKSTVTETPNEVVDTQPADEQVAVADEPVEEKAEEPIPEAPAKKTATTRKKSTTTQKTTTAKKTSSTKKSTTSNKSAE